MSECTVKVAQAVEKNLEFKVSDEVTSDHSPFKVIDSDEYSIALFPAKVNNEDPEKKSRLKYNARVTLKSSGITFQMVVKELKKDGVLIAGQAGRTPARRTILTDWDGDKKISYERMSVPSNTYKEIIGIISAVGQDSEGE